MLASTKWLVWSTRLLFVLPLGLFGFGVGFFFATVVAAHDDLPGALAPAGGFGAVVALIAAGWRHLRRPPITAGDERASWSQLLKLVLGAGAAAGALTFLLSWALVLGFKLTAWGEAGVAVLFVAQFVAIAGAGPLGALLFWQRLARPVPNGQPAASAA